MNAHEFDTLLTMLRAAYPRFTMERPTMALYEQLLQDIPGDEAVRAVREIICTSESDFFPTVATIRRTVATMRVSAAPAETEWEHVLRAIGSQGRYRIPVFKSDITAQAVACIGWDTLCNSELIGVERAAFMKAYAAIANREQREANMGALEGRPYQSTGLLPKGPEETH